MLIGSKTNILDSALLRSSLQQWYLRHYRQLPWRETRNPYHIWLSEIILQQTRVEQGLPYYERFTESFPQVADLANAPVDKVLKLWEGLGYYSRARNLHHAAQSIVEDFDGEFPSNYDDIRSLKGIGDYTAAAIASFAFDLAHAVVDGNVLRVLSRLHADARPINTSAGKKQFQAYADEFLDIQDPATHNQAMMELGATVCKPRDPLCEVCPLREACLAKAKNQVLDFPVKQKKHYDQERFLNYWFLHLGDETLIGQRKSGIWQGLYQFPIYESGNQLQQEEAQNILSQEGVAVGGRPIVLHRLPKHKLSHQTLFISIWEFWLSPDVDLSKWTEYERLSIQDLKGLAFPRPLRKFLDENQLTLPLE